MGFNITKEAYTKLIEEDLAVLNKHMPDSLELDHIKVVLTSSIDCYYPSDSNPANSKPTNCAIFDVSQQRELLAAFVKDWYKDNPMVDESKQLKMVDKFLAAYSG